MERKQARHLAISAGLAVVGTLTLNHLDTMMGFFILGMALGHAVRALD